MSKPSPPPAMLTVVSVSIENNFLSYSYLTSFKKNSLLLTLILDSQIEQRKKSSESCYLGESTKCGYYVRQVGKVSYIGKLSLARSWATNQ